MIRIFIQARMTSHRFPGKVLAPLAGQPVIAHVIGAVRRVVPGDDETIVLTSTDRSDDPLASYLGHLGVPVFRGPLDDVFSRFRQALAFHPCEWFVRVCADSPMLRPSVLAEAIELAKREAVDLVTNAFPRTFPRGTSVEVVRTEPFLAIDPGRLTPLQREHVTRCYYDDPGRFRIRNFESTTPGEGYMSVAVDSIEDLRRVEQLLQVAVTP